MDYRTASEFKIKRAQGSSSTADATASRALTPGPGGVPELDLSSGTADEAADRALTAVANKLDRALSTEYTVNELIAEATDSTNLACMFIGGLVFPVGHCPSHQREVLTMCVAGWSPHQ
jgi:serine-protein kinase ATM